MEFKEIQNIVSKLRDKVRSSDKFAEYEREELRLQEDTTLTPEKKRELEAAHREKLNPLIRERLRQMPESRNLSITDQVNIVKQVYSSICGFGLLDSIMDDETITEVMVNGHKNIFIEKQGKIIKLEQEFESDEEVVHIITQIVSRAGRRIGFANPICDCVLPDGSRVNAVIAPVSLGGPTLTIRRFSKSPMTMERLLELGSLQPDVAEILKTLVRARYNIFICGGTGSGKTTFLNALSNYIPQDERIITIEDSAELQITNVQNLVSLQVKQGNKPEEEISIRDLIKSSLRMRPDRIIVGEVRGAEALDMLQAMNTGHDGSISTGHANSPNGMLSRLETMVLQGASGLPLEAIRQQIGTAIDIIVHLSRLRDKSRKTMSITEVVGYVRGENGTAGYIELNPLYEFVIDEENSDEHHVAGQLKPTGKRLKKRFKLEQYGLKLDI